MSSFAWMRVLESAAQRYDRGIRLLSHGRIDELYHRIAELALGRSAVGPGIAPRVLDLGCGTGGATLACAARGARVVGIDRNAAMLEVARGKPLPAGGGSVQWLELSAMELEDRFGPNSFDAVVSCLAFSEIGEAEQDYVLAAARSRLVAGGRLVVADEVVPRSPWRRAAHRLRHLPATLLAYLLTQTSTRPVAGLPARVAAAGFEAVGEERMWGDSFAIVTARAPAGTAPEPRT